MTTPKIRDARRDDLADIVRIYNDSIPGGLATADTVPVTLESRIPWFEAHTPHQHPLWVVDGRQAWLSFRPFYGRPAYEKSAEISIYVSTQFQRQGFGALLLGHALAAAPRLGIDRLVGFIFSHNFPSVCLFQQHGFQEWGLLPGLAEIEGVRRDLQILGKIVLKEN
jgi:phosphinothricin acetyltransferase